MHAMKYILIILSFFILSKTSAQDFEGIKKINGTDLFLSIKGKGDNLVIIHGGPGLNHSYFQPHLKTLEKKFRVVYYDQRACGKSSIPSPDSISMKFLVEDLEGIRKELKIEKLNLLAHSWGVVLATHYALAYPKRINKIIFSDPALLSREYDAAAGELMKKKTSKEDSAARANIMAAGKLDVPQYDALLHLSFRASAHNKENMQKVNLDLPANFLEGNKALFTGLMKDPAQQANLYDSLKAFRFPVLLIHGEADIIPMASVERTRSNLSKVDLHIFKQSGHFPFVEEPQRYGEVVTTFLKRK
jgi:proline iminopeptidase